MDWKEASREILNYFELNKNENTVHQTLWDIAKDMLRGISAFTRRDGLLPYISFYLMEIEVKSK